MDYAVYVQDEKKIVLCVCEGILDLASAKSMTRDVRKKAFDLGYGLLYDVTKISLGVGIPDAYFFPRDIANIYEDPMHRIGKVAIAYESDKDFWEFFETTAQNTGVDVVVFCEIEKALKWLSGEQPSYQFNKPDLAETNAKRLSK